MSSSEVDSPLPDADDIRAVLAFLPILQAPGFRFGEGRGGERCDDGVITMPYFSTSEQSSAFVQALYDHRFIRPFEWGKWQDEARRYVEDPALIETADLETICKLLTTHVRKDRFCEGHLASMFECGQITALVTRIAAIWTKLEHEHAAD